MQGRISLRQRIELTAASRHIQAPQSHSTMSVSEQRRRIVTISWECRHPANGVIEPAKDTRSTKGDMV